MDLPIARSRRVNKILFFIFLSLFAVAFVVLVIATALYQDSLMVTALVLCLITAAFSFLYGILWAVFAHKEKKANREMNYKVDVLYEELYTPNRDDLMHDQVFTLPREELLATAQRRLDRSTVLFLLGGLGLGVALFLFVSCFVGFEDGFGRFIASLAFGLICSIPGFGIQGSIYNAYESHLPGEIRLGVGELTIDGERFPMREIREIVVSSPSSRNPEASKIFRTLTVKTDAGSKVYNIDYRRQNKNEAYNADYGIPSEEKDKSPRWDRYMEFCGRLQDWATYNHVKADFDFMD